MVQSYQALLCDDTESGRVLGGLAAHNPPTPTENETETLGRIQNPVAIMDIRSRIQIITGKFTSLLCLTKQKLKSLPIDIEDLRLHLIVEYSPSDSLVASAGGNINTILGAATTVDAIFSALTTHRLWDHLNYHLLQSIVKEFASRDEELNLQVEQYQRDVTEFLVNTKIKDYLVAIQSDTLAAENVLETPNPGLFSELSFKMDAKIMEHPLQYVDNLSKSLAAQFHLPVSMLLFHKITESCLTVNWRVLSNLVPLLRTKVPESASFLDQIQVLKVTLLSDHEECLYSLKGKQGAKLGKRSLSQTDHEEGPSLKVFCRRRRCGKCDGCLRIQDCGDCINCKNKPKYGGPGTRKKPCKYRQCNNLQAALPVSTREKKEKTSQAKRPAVIVGITGDMQHSVNEEGKDDPEEIHVLSDEDWSSSSESVMLLEDKEDAVDTTDDQCQQQQQKQQQKQLQQQQQQQQQLQQQKKQQQIQQQQQQLQTHGVLLGNGFFGTVYKTSYNGIPAAAKHLYQSYSSAQNSEKFKELFKALMEAIHPNLASYLAAATYPNPQSDTPALVIVTELMERNLTQFLGEAQCDIPIHLQINLCLDICFALAHLHSQQILHGNLRSNNVLLVGTTAKVADYGMAKLLGIQHSAICAPYLPPEAQVPHIQYSEKFDIYALGVLMVQIATREQPSLIPQPQQSQQRILKMTTAHPLQDITLQCLKDSSNERPTAHSVAKKLIMVRHHKLYATSLKQEKEAAQQEFVQLEEMAKSREEVVMKQRQENQKIQKAIDQLQQQLKERDQTISTLQIAMKQQCQKLQSEMQELATTNKQKLSQLDTQTQQLQQQLKDKNNKMSTLHSTNEQQSQALKSSQQQLSNLKLKKQEELEKKDQAISTLQTTNKQQHQALQTTQLELSNQKKKHQEELEKKNIEIEKKKEEILRLSSIMTRESTQLQSQLKQLQEDLQGRDKRNSDLHQRLVQAQQQLRGLQNASAQQRQSLEEKTREIANLKQKNQREMQQKDQELAQLTSEKKQQLSLLGAQTHQLKLQKQVQESQTKISKLTKTIDSQVQKNEKLDLQISNFRSRMQELEKQAAEWKCWEGDVKGALESLSSVVYRRKQLMHVKKEDSKSLS